MKIRFISLASGSSGNCYYLGTEKYGILIDAGIGIRTIKKSLKDINVTMDSIRAVFITHWQDAGLESMYTVLLQRDSRNEVCLQRINAYLRQEFDYELDHQEQVYLLIHLTKIVRCI